MVVSQLWQLYLMLLCIVLNWYKLKDHLSGSSHTLGGLGGGGGSRDFGLGGSGGPSSRLLCELCGRRIGTVVSTQTLH